jgi:hypothetical protein
MLMMRHSFRVIAGAAISALPFVFSFAHAETFQNPLGPKNRSLLGILCNVRDGLFPILLAFGVIAFLVAAYLYFFSGGDASKISSSKKALTAAIIGVALAILSFGLPSIVAELFGVSANDLPAQCQ